MRAVRNDEEQAVIAEAKRRLMAHMQWDEPCAYVAMRDAAMNHRVKLIEIAERVVQAGDRPHVPLASSPPRGRPPVPARR